MKKDLQLEDVHTCGIWGNIGTETGGFTALQEKAPTVKGSRGGYGWMQWTGPRRKKYEAWAKAKGLAVAADETNYLYLIQETLTDEWKSVAQTRKTTTLEAATETFMLLNLRPGKPNLKSRLEWAQKAADALKQSAGTKPALQNKPLSKAPVAAGVGAVGTGLLYYYWHQITQPLIDLWNWIF